LARNLFGVRSAAIFEDHSKLIATWPCQGVRRSYYAATSFRDRLKDSIACCGRGSLAFVIGGVVDRALDGCLIAG
jgi:hypothetical protein